MTTIEPKLGDKVTFTGTVKKNGRRARSGLITYDDAPLPGFEGYKLETTGSPDDPMRDWRQTFRARSEGFVMGKRRYIPMERDEGLWVPQWDSDKRTIHKGFIGYLVAWHLSRKPVIVRLDQITHIEGVKL